MCLGFVYKTRLLYLYFNVIVNYAVTDSKLKIAEDKSVIALNLQIDENICSRYDYFEIFLERMMFCRKSAEILGTAFKLTANGRKVL